MLIPTIYIFDDTNLFKGMDNVKDATLKYVDTVFDIPGKSLGLHITDKADTFRPNSESGSFIYCVYTGSDDMSITEEPYILDRTWGMHKDKDLNALFVRWTRSIIRDYQAHIYRMLLQTLIDSSPNMVWFKDRQERHVILNQAFCDIVHKDYDFCIGKKHPDIWDIPWDEYESSDFACRQSEEEIMRTGKMGVFQEPVLTGTELRQFTTYKSPLYDPFGNIIGTCGIGHDVTNVNNMGKELDIFLQAIPYPAFLCDKSYEIQRMNSAAKGLVRLQDAKMYNYKTWKTVFLHKEKNQRIGEGRIYTYMNGINKVYYSVVEKDVKDYFGNITGHFCMLRDVTYQCMYDDLMFQAANIDPLTGAYNRRYFYDAMEKNTGSPLTLLYMDLDNFKAVNDTYGHTKGDEVLKATAEIIKSQFPEYNLIRLGGDEFAMLIPGVVEKDAIRDKLDSITAQVTALIESDIRLGISIGYESTEMLDDAESFFNECDRHMYEKKHRHHSKQKKAS